jgi:multidrug efflux system membrane fusion protein
VAAFETVRITARVSGVVERVLVAEGDRVAKDQVIAEIDPERYRVALAAADAGFRRAETAQAESRASYARRLELHRQGMVSEEDLASVRLRSEQAEAEVRAQQAAVDRARLDLRDAKVVAAAAGIIQSRAAETGAWVQPGSPIATLLHRDPLQARFSVTVEEAARLAPGMRVELRTRGLEGVFAGSVALVSAAADPGTRLVGVVARIEDPEGRLRPGAFAEIGVVAGEARELPSMPELAIRASERGFVVFVAVEEAADGGGRRLVARERQVVLGQRDPAGWVEVRSGIAPGEQVVVRGADAVRDGSELRATEAGRSATASRAR